MIFGKNLNKYYLKYWYLFVIGIIALFFVDYVGSVLPPKIIGSIIDELDNHTLTLEILFSNYISKLILVLVIVFVGRFLWRIGFFGVAYLVRADLRHRLFKKSLTLSQTFYNNNKVGGLMSYYINDVDSVGESMSWASMMTCDCLFLIPMVLVQMFKTNWVIALICLLPLFIIACAGGIVEKFMEKKYKRRQDEFEFLSDYTQESISGIRVVKAFVKEAQELKGFMKKNKDNEDVNMDYLKLSVIFNVFIDFFIWSIYLIIIGVGSYFVFHPETNITIGELTMLIAYFDNLLWPMFAIGDIINMSSRGKASLKRIDFILDQVPDLIEAKEPLDISDFKGNISFNHLSFHFPDSQNVNALNDVTLDIKAGEFVGIIGRTGSSKTTLVNLLLRLYNVDKDEILLDGEDIMNYRIKDVRENIGYVPQDNFLYSSTIESNIAFSTSTPDKEKVEREAMIAGVHNDIIAFPKGYETILGERGVSVSGGQKQRISIARALYKNPKVLILDDSLSAVDTKTESEILDFLKNERKGKTTILIAHRISSIKDADKILVLDKGGTVSGFDTHENLLKNNKIYQETYSLQRLDDEGGITNA